MTLSFTKYLWLLPAVLALGVNLNVLQNGTVWDDNYILRGGGASFLGAAIQKGSEKLYFRPAVDGLFQAERRLWGDHPLGYHLTNLLLHALNTVLVFMLGRAVLAGGRNPGRGRGPDPAIAGDAPDAGRNAWRPCNVVPLLAALLFAVHPVHAEAVAWIAGRNDLLPAFFLLIAFILHVRLRNGGRPAWILPLWASALFLALLSKESALPFLLVFPLYDLLARPEDRRGWKRLFTPSTAAAALIGALYLALRSGQLGSAAGALEMESSVSAGTLATVLYALGFYVKHLFFPFPLNAFILFPETFGPAEIGMMVPGVLFIGALIVATVVRKTRVPSLSLWAVFLGLAMPLAVPLVRVAHAPVAERYLYLPSIGFCFLAAALLTAAAKRGFPDRIRPALSASLGVLLLAGLSAETVERNAVWRNDRSLWEDTVLKSPTAAVPHNLLGLVYRRENRNGDAAREFERAINARGDAHTHVMAASNLGAVYYGEGRFDRAEEAYKKAIAFKPDINLPYYNLGILYWERYRSGEAGGNELLEKARTNLVRSVFLNPFDANSYYVLGLVNLSLGRRDMAREHFQTAVRLSPESRSGREAAGKLREMGNGK